MHLKQIEISGFKSFADKTEVIFEKGVTCVVGPNGCGKSNISDAIRWVLGERSAKTLRGAKMEDVIFHGTDFRKPTNVAEVSLTIDNSDHALPIEYEDVVITRRLYRSGESEYLINKTLCRLKDVQDLILDTGIGSNAYSMIEQGKIDYILSAEPEERRFLIEEAAGISKYKVKKDEAIRKLELTEQNLLRLNDIVTEVERNIRYAERQAKRAEKYREHHDQLKRLELAKLAQFVSELNLNKQRFIEEQQLLQNQINEESSILLSLESELKELEKICEESDRDFFQAEQNRIQLEEKILAVRKEIETTRERYHETKTALDRCREDVILSSQQIDRFIHDISEKEMKLSEIQNTHQILNTEKGQIEEFLSQLTNAVNQNAITLIRYREQNFEIASQLADIKNEMNHLALKNQSRNEKQKRNLDTIDKLKEEIRQCQEKSGLLANEIATAHLDDENNKTALKELSLRKENASCELQQLHHQISEFQSKQSEAVHRLHLLDELDGIGFTKVIDILEKDGVRETVGSRVLCSLLDLIEIDSEYEVAAEAALADMTKAVVASDTKTAVQLLKHIQSAGYHQASIFIRDKTANSVDVEYDPVASTHSLVQARLVDKIKVKEGYEGIIRELIGRVYVVNEITEENYNECERLAEHVKIVSKKGACLGPGFQLTLRNGSLQPIKDYLARESEKEHLKETIGSSKQSFSAAEERKEVLEKELLGYEIEIKSKFETSVAFQMQIERLETTQRALESQKIHCEQEIQLIEQELCDLKGEEVSSSARDSEIKEKLRSYEQSNSDLKVIFENESRWMDEKKKEKEEKLIELAKIQTRLETHAENEKQLLDAINTFRNGLNDSRKRLELLNENERTYEERLKKLEGLSQQLLLDEKQIQTDLISISAIVKQKSEHRGVLLLQRNEIAHQLSNRRNSVNALNVRIHDGEKKEMELEYQKNSSVERIKNTYQMTIDDTQLNLDSYADIDLSAIDSLIDGLKDKVSQLGTVNLLAIEEYEEMKQRFEFLEKQKKDLEDSRESLLEAIRKINKTTKKLFEETFVEVRQMFKSYFRLLFEGGESDLVLLDEQNPLESGIDISARPPGKKNQHVGLLSGGEKALTAIALLFALFKIKPSPFCVLDEVDAPLDEANNERFLRVLREFLLTTQFIIVTHNRKSISMGDSLYGVTMEEAGVSRLVSVRIGNSTLTIEHSDEKVQKELNAVLQ